MIEATKANARNIVPSLGVKQFRIAAVTKRYGHIVVSKAHAMVLNCNVCSM